MSEETNTDPAIEETPEPAAPTNADFKKTALFDTMAKQVKDARDALSAMKAAEADKAKADRDDALKAQGNWDTLEAEMRAENEALRASHAKKEMDWKLRSQLSGPFEDTFFIDAMAQKYPGDADGIEAYVKDLAEAEDFVKYRKGYVPEASAATPPVGSTPAARSTGTTLKDRLNSNNPEVKKAAVSEQFQALLRGESVD